MSMEERLADLERRVAELEAWRAALPAAEVDPAAEQQAGDHLTEDERRARRMGPGG